MYTRADCEAIRKDLNIALEEIGKRHNTKLQVGNIRYGSTELSISIKGMLIEDPGVSPEQALFNRLAPEYGIPADAFGETVIINERAFTVCGINPNARKNAILLSANGKNYSCSPLTLQIALKNQDQ